MSATPRKALSKALRYEVLRRDNFTCRYCGASAPEVVLTVDHVTPVALGGDNQPGNLVAACKDCNAGKSATSSDNALIADVEQDAVRWARAMRTVAEAYEQQAEERQEALDEFEEAWDSWTYGTMKRPIPIDPQWRASVDNWLKLGMTMPLLIDSMQRAMRSKASPDGTWRYFCGIAWSRLTEMQTAARLGIANTDNPWRSWE